MKKWLYILVVFLMLISVVQVVVAFSPCIPTLSVKPQQVIRGEAVVFSGSAYSYLGAQDPIGGINLFETSRGVSKKQDKWIAATLITDWTQVSRIFFLGKYSIKIYPTKTSYYQVSCVRDLFLSSSNKVKVTVIDQISET